MILGPTFAEMRNPTLIDPLVLAKAAKADPLDPIRLFSLRWADDQGKVRGWLVPSSLTGVEAPIVMMLGNGFPTGSHKVGPAYSCLIEQQLSGEIEPGRDTLVFPSTGNYGIGGAWVGPRMGYESLVVLPEEMSTERFVRIRGYGAEIIATPGSESNVKEIYDEVKRLKLRDGIKVLNQFEAFGNYRFHHGVTGPAAETLSRQLGFGGRVAAFVSAMGSGGTIAAGDYLKSAHGAAIVGLEPVQCPTLYNVGYGAHRIEGIGDKHVTWIHNVLNMDALICIDDDQCVRGLQLLQEADSVLRDELGFTEGDFSAFRGNIGVSGICNLLGAIKSARALKLGKDDLVVTVATDGFDRYPSVLEALVEREGPQTNDVAKSRLSAFHAPDMDMVQHGTESVRTRWHNQKYFTWVEQQGKSLAELEQLKDQDYWANQASLSKDIDKRIIAAR